MSSPENQIPNDDEQSRHDALEPRNRVSTEPRVSTIIWGIVLVALGGTFLLDQLGIIDRGFLYDWWPVALIAVGIFSRGHFLTAVGTFILIGKTELWGLTYSTAWPVILVIIGAGIIIDSFLGDHRCGTFGSGGAGR